jgi:hypothetical protein
LGDPDKAIHHYKQSAKEATSTDISRAQSVKNRIAKCNEARKLKDWVGVTKEAQSAIIDGADSAPQVLSLKLGKREKKESNIILYHLTFLAWWCWWAGQWGCLICLELF